MTIVVEGQARAGGDEADEEGVVVVLDAGAELKILAANQLDGAILATPAIVDGTLYVRTESHLYAFGN